MRKKRGRPAGVKQKLACTQTCKRTYLLDLPESLITSILRCLPTESKCQAERVCSAFREVLSNPAPGSFVWDRVNLEDAVFQKLPVDALRRQVSSMLSCFDLTEPCHLSRALEYHVAHALMLSHLGHAH